MRAKRSVRSAAKGSVTVREMWKFVLRSIAAMLLLCCFAEGAFAQTQAVLPGGMSQFADGNGAPYAGGHVYMYVPSTTTPKATYQDPYGASANSNPITLDANGRAIIWGSGVYRQVLQDSYGNVVWDQLTYASPASAGGAGTGTLWYGTAQGTANAITLVGPTGFTATDGQTVGFVAASTNTSATTINASGYGSLVVEKNTPTGPALLTGGEIVARNLEVATYSASANAFLLANYPVNQAFGAQVALASAATTDLGTVASRNVQVVGTTTITSFGSSANVASPIYLVAFGGVLTITESSALLTPNSGNIITASGDSALVAYLGSGNWQILGYFAAVPAQVYVSPPQFRLSTTSGNPFSTPSATGAQIVYAVPFGGNLVPLWNGTTFVPTPCGQMSNILANASTGNAGPAAAVAASVYDLVAWNNAGVCTLTRDVAWTNVTTPAAGDAFAWVNGILTNSTAITNGPAAGYGTYLGTFATDAGGVTVTFNPTPAAASGGPTNGAWVGLWNEYNRIATAVTAVDSASGWADSSSAWKGLNNGSVNDRISVVCGQPTAALAANLVVDANVSLGSVTVRFGILQDSTSASPVIASVGAYSSGSGVVPNTSSAVAFAYSVGSGLHYLQAAEYVSASSGASLGPGALSGTWVY